MIELPTMTEKKAPKKTGGVQPIPDDASGLPASFEQIVKENDELWRRLAKL